MVARDPANEHLKRLRQWRNRKEPDQSMAFLKPYFKQEVERPHKQLGALAELWRTLAPSDLVAHTRLEALSRGVLRVAVDSSARLYELDHLLRAGLEQKLIVAHKGPAFRKVQLRIDAGLSSQSKDRTRQMNDPEAADLET